MITIVLRGGGNGTQIEDSIRLLINKIFQIREELSNLTKPHIHVLEKALIIFFSNSYNK